MESLLLLLFLLVLALPLFLGARRQKKAMREAQELQSSLVVGERVLTTSGVQATIVDLGDETVDLEIAPGVRTTWVRAAIRERLVDRDADAEIGDDTAADVDPARTDRT